MADKNLVRHGISKGSVSNILNLQQTDMHCYRFKCQVGAMLNTSSDGNNLEIFGYNLIRSDHHSKNKRGGICICYKHILPLRILNVQYFQK